MNWRASLVSWEAKKMCRLWGYSVDVLNIKTISFWIQRRKRASCIRMIWDPPVLGTCLGMGNQSTTGILETVLSVLVDQLRYSKTAGFELGESKSASLFDAFWRYDPVDGKGAVTPGSVWCEVIDQIAKEPDQRSQTNLVTETHEFIWNLWTRVLIEQGNIHYHLNAEIITIWSQ